MNFEVVMRALLFGPMIAFIVLLFLALPQALQLSQQQVGRQYNRAIEKLSGRKTMILFPLLVTHFLFLGYLEMLGTCGFVIATMLRKNEYIVIKQLQEAP